MKTSKSSPLAIVGMSCRFPGGADDPDRFWNLLMNRRSGIVPVPPDRWNRRRYYHHDSEVPGRMVSNRGGFVDDVQGFDAQFFGISPREAEHMDPQQRWMLEVAWQALEDAAINPHALRGKRVGVFVGIASRDYNDIKRGDISLLDIHSGTGTASSIAANRLSYFFDFKGPSMAVDTACSSALVAAHLACESIWSGQSDLALAGGVNVILDPNVSIGFSKANMLSPEGICYTFDHRANGYVRGEGAGLVVIKPLAQAEADEDRIYAVIRSTSINQDGRSSSLTVPDIDAQAALLREAYTAAGMDPADVVYIEAHGTGTPVGDPIEARAIGQIVGMAHPENDRCLIGSVKTNIGHLEAASGVAGLIKAALVLHHGMIPANLNFERPNPNIPMDQLRLEVVSEARPLPDHHKARPVVGVNSFGFGGTNAHVVLEKYVPAEAPVVKPGPSRAQRPILLPLSGANDAALKAGAEIYHRFLGIHYEQAAAIATAAGTDRVHLAQRLVVIGEDAAALQARLLDYQGGAKGLPCVITGSPAADVIAPVFVFTGQGAQWWGMGQTLWKREPCFRQIIEEIDALFKPMSGWSLIDEMGKNESNSRIDDTDVAQPAIFALQVALAGLWKEWGITPSKVMGHSVGEAAAAYVAGIYTLEDAVTIIRYRSRLQNQTAGQGGGMAAVAVTQAEALAAIKDYAEEVQIAAINSSNMVTLSGSDERVKDIAEQFAAKGKFVKKLPIRYAFHSYQMDPIKDELISVLSGIHPMAGNIPFISTVIGEQISGESMTGAYWWDNVRQPVRFGRTIDGLITGGYTTFLELGPHPALASSLNECLAAQNRQGRIFHSLHRATDETEEILKNLASLHVYGLPVNWKTANQSEGRFMGLPAYPWQHQRHWLKNSGGPRFALEAFSHPLLGMHLSGPQQRWEFQLDPRLLPYLNDHRIWDGIVFPAAGFGEIGLAVARTLYPDDRVVVEDLQIHNALFTSLENIPTVQVVYEDKDHSFHIYSESGSKTEWKLHAEGYIRKLAPRELPRIDLPALRAEMNYSADRDSYYRFCKEMGYGFGPDFRQIEFLWGQEGAALAEIQITESVRTQKRDYHFHPALLDACLQTIIAAAFLNAEPQGVCYLPAAIGRIDIFREPLPDVFRVLAQRVQRDQESIAGWCTVTDDQGNRLAEIHNVRFVRVKESMGSSTEAPQHYQYQWEQKELKAQSPDRNMDPSPGAVLCFADADGIADRIRERFAETGYRVFMVTPGLVFEQHDMDHFQIDPASVEDLKHLFHIIHKTGIPTKKLLHAWSLDHTHAASLNPDALYHEQDTGVKHVFRLALAMHTRALEHPPDVIVLTRDLQVVTDGDQCSALIDAPLIGFLRVARNEYLRNRWALIDLEDAAPLDDLDTLFYDITADTSETEIAYRNGKRYVNRLKTIDPETMPPRLYPGVSDKSTAFPYRLQINKPGQIRHLSLNRTMRWKPGPDEVEVRIRAGGLNFRDVMKALGLYPGNPADLRRLGDDFAGVVERVGENVTAFAPGDAVAGMGTYTFRSYLTLDHRVMFRKPPFMSFEEAATIPTVFLTAYYALVHLARMQPGEKVLIHAATGGVGQAAIQVAQDLGLEIYATAGTPEKRALLRKQGVQHIFDSRSLSFADDVMTAANGYGVDAVLNSLAGDFIPKNLSVMAPFGRYLEIGKVDVYKNSNLGLEALRNNLSVFIIDLAQLMEHRPQIFMSILKELQAKFEAKAYRALPMKAFPITEAIEAFRYMASGKHIGKNVLAFNVDHLDVHRIDEDGFLFDPACTYLITGAAGGVGLEVAGWMSAHGAQHLVLMSRSGPSTEEARLAIERMRSAGISVIDARGDVTVRADVERIVCDIQSSGAPLAGVIHCAMVLNDEHISLLDEESFDQAFLPKMLGAWNLHAATLDLPLEHFICFSSISSIIGTVRQVNYAAGNAFLDMLACHRRAIGKPALTINWGSLSGAGVVARNRKIAGYLGKAGIDAMTMHTTLQAFRRMLSRDVAQVLIAPIHWNELGRYLPAVARSKSFEYVMGLSSSGSADKALIEHILSAPENERAGMVEHFLIGLLADVLGMQGDLITTETPLNQIGLDSLMAVEFIIVIKSRLAIQVSVSDVLGGTHIRDIALVVLDRLISSGRTEVPANTASEDLSGLLTVPDQDENRIDLALEARLDPSIAPSPAAQPPAATLKCVFLTGATGFLGAFLLHDLLRECDVRIICLVRNVLTEQEGFGMLRDNLLRYGRWDDSFESRIIPLIGDLSQPLLGLSEQAFDELSSSADVIYHNGAWVNMVRPYHVLKASNVEAVKDILRLACRVKIKPVHYVSTISVFFSSGKERDTVIRESAWPDPEQLQGGYIQTKWVAEQLIRQAGERGLPVAIYRPGIIMGDSKTGVTNSKDLASMLIKGSYKLGLSPDKHTRMNILPVDYVSRGIAVISQHPDAAGKVFHLTNPSSTPLEQVLQWAGDFARKVAVVPYKQWRYELVQRAKQGIENDLIALLPFFPAEDLDQFEQQVDCTNTLNILAQSDIVCPMIDEPLIRTYAEYLLLT
jgi:thioester reductase-like protein